jgi:excisionase family DNA binding protein
LDLNEAAGFLRMNAETLRRKAKSGEIPGAKVGKQWVFIDEDLAAYIRSQYASPRQTVRVTDRCLKEVRPCRSTVAVARGGSALRPPTATEYNEALGLRTEQKRNTSTIS